MINSTKLEVRKPPTPLHKKILLYQQVQSAERNSIVKLDLCISQEIGCTIEIGYKTDHNNVALRRVQEARREEEKMEKKASSFSLQKTLPNNGHSPFLYRSLSSLKKALNSFKNTSKIK
jgi:hypothetical protein